jgi:hypothetical protein
MIHFSNILPSMPRSSKHSLSLKFSYKNTVCFSLFHCVCHMPCPSHVPWLNHPNHVSSVSHAAPHYTVFSHFLLLCLMINFFPQHCVMSTVRLRFSINVRDHVTSYKGTGNTVVPYIFNLRVLSKNTEIRLTVSSSRCHQLISAVTVEARNC